MKNIKLSQQLLLGLIFIGASMGIASREAIAFDLWTISNDARFNDNTSISGSFEYDINTGSYQNVNIATQNGSGLSATTYNTNHINNSSASSLILCNENQTLSLNFINDLANGGNILFATDSSQEQITLNPSTVRFIANGGIIQQEDIPFTFSPSLGIFSSFCLFGIPILVKKLRR